MEVSFDDEDLAETCRHERKLRQRYGLARAKKIQQRLKALQGAATLADLRDLPGRCHELSNDLAGLLSLDLGHPFRLLFRPSTAQEPGPGGGLDWSAVTAVTVVRIVDTHD